LGIPCDGGWGGWRRLPKHCACSREGNQDSEHTAVREWVTVRHRDYPVRGE